MHDGNLDEAVAAYRKAVQAAPDNPNYKIALQRAGLITQRRESRQLIYSVDFSVMNGLVGYLTENCCGNNSAQCSPICAPVQPAKVVKRTAKVA